MRSCGRRERGEGEETATCTFEVRHLFPLLPVALSVDPGLRVADLPGRRQPQGRRGDQVLTYHALLADERDGLRRVLQLLHSGRGGRNSPGTSGGYRKSRREITK